jgi:hypothetical protein
MKPFRGLVSGCALAILAAGAVPCRAAWDNVFQVCCASCGQPATAYYAPVAAAPCNPCPCPCPPPQRVCTTRYVQRSYYQPVVSYQTRSYYERVTSYHTSYYWAPVTSYHYSCYVDPCTGCTQQVACPTTCYQLRSQCCPVESWVQRCCQVPVTTYQQSCYWEPVTTCCEVPACPPSPCPPTVAPAVVPAVPVPATQPPATLPPQPGVLEQRNIPVPNVSEYRSGGVSNPPYGTYPPSVPQTSPPPVYNRQVTPQAGTPGVPAAPAATPPKVRLDHIVLGSGSNVAGLVVYRDQAPHAGAQLLFIDADRQGNQQTVTADERGRFRVTLASGGWLVYVRGPDGKPVFRSRIDVRGDENKTMTLVSR